MLWYIATQKADLPATLRLRTIDATVDLGAFYPFFIYLVVAGTTNAVNLTDGLDGLAAGCTAIVILAYIGITFITAGQHDLSLLAGCLVGACVGFLWFNAFPATIFMGDTGSLGLGGAIAGLAVMTKTEEILVLAGGIFVVEALSVLIQVFSFQTFRKRVFLMAPIHHHFEILGWSETKIILRFWIIAAICAASASRSTSSRSPNRRRRRLRPQLLVDPDAPRRRVAVARVDRHLVDGQRQRRRLQAVGDDRQRVVGVVGRGCRCRPRRSCRR